MTSPAATSSCADFLHPSSFILHPSPASLWQRLRHGARWLWQRGDWQRFAGADWAERIMAVEVTDRFHAKQGRSTGRWILERDGRRLGAYLKRHYRLAWWQGLLALLWPSRGWSPARQEWRNLQWARAQGWPVPAPVAVGEFIGPWGRLQSVLAIEELADMLPLHEAIPLAAQQLPPDTFDLWKDGLVAEVARLVRQLHDRRCFHKDLYLCHFYIPQANLERLGDWRGRVHVIDLHRLGQHRWTWPFWQVKDLAQLLYSSRLEGVEEEDRLRFWQQYQPGRPERWLAWCVRAKEWFYRRHNAKRRNRSPTEPRPSGSGAASTPAP